MVITHKLDETIEFGRKLGQRLRPGDVIALRGNLGIGKTQLVHGIAQTYLGAPTHVCSPSPSSTATTPTAAPSTTSTSTASPRSKNSNPQATGTPSKTQTHSSSSNGSNKSTAHNPSSSSPST